MSSMPEIPPVAVVYCAVGSCEAALEHGRVLVTERLAACANVLDGVASVYHWKGAVQEDREAVLILKTRSALVPQVIERLRSLHSYDCPGIVSWPLTTGHRDYLEWIVRETRES